MCYTTMTTTTTTTSTAAARRTMAAMCSRQSSELRDVLSAMTTGIVRHHQHQQHRRHRRRGHHACRCSMAASTTTALFIAVLCCCSSLTATQAFQIQAAVPSTGMTTSSSSPFARFTRSSSMSPSSSSSPIVLYYNRGHDDNNNNEILLNEEPSNEWGIPTSASLPPLALHARRRGPLPQRLPNGGRVTLVGSGPGDPDLLTVSAYRLLTSTTNDDSSSPPVVVIADRLVSAEILAIIPPTTTVHIARKLPGCAELAQEEIYWLTYQALNQGKHVIRLKIGDPFVFGRGGEEVLTFRKFGVEAVVIPGVSAAFSAPLLGNIPVTHRGVANQVVMCTGYGREGTSPDLIRYHKEQTIVFLMAVGRLSELCQRLQEQAGYPARTPVAIVERAGCPDQRTVIGDMTTIAELALKHKIKPPSTIIVGDVVNVLIQDQYDAADQHNFVSGLIQNATAV